MISSAQNIDCGSDCNCEGNITADSFMQGDFQLRSECIGSYFQLSISSGIDLKPASDFNMTINEEINQNIASIAKLNFLSSGTNFTGALLASRSANVLFSAPQITQDGLHDFSIYYKEINQTFGIGGGEPINYNDGQIILDPEHKDNWKPNEQRKYLFRSKFNVQNFTMSWNFSSEASTASGLSPSSSFGYIALRNSNGKISLVTGPSGNDLKFAVGMPRDLEDLNDPGDSTIDVITQNDPEANVYLESKRRIILNYELGEDINITTPGPPTTTPKVPSKDDGIHIFILPVNEQNFYEKSFQTFVDELKDLASDSRCELINTDAMSCHDECFMSNDPDRGCLGVIVGLVNDPLICNKTQEEFKDEIENKIPDWQNEFSVDRIELDDCLASQQKIWIITGVAIMVFALGVFIISFVVFKIVQKNKRKNEQYDRISNASSDHHIPSSSQRQKPYTQPSPFEDVQL